MGAEIRVVSQKYYAKLNNGNNFDIDDTTDFSRNLAGGVLEEIKAVAQKSKKVIEELGAGIVWRESYVVDNMTYCIYDSESVDLIEEHGKCTGLPTSKISEVKMVLNPAEY